MQFRLLLSILMLLSLPRIGLAQPPNAKNELNQVLASFGSVVGEPNSNTGATLTYYFKMTHPALTFPGGTFPVIIAIACTLALSPSDYFCTATVPSNVGVPPSFPTAFILPKSP